jgi:hypothetical protein
MGTGEIVAALDATIERLQKARRCLGAVAKKTRACDSPIFIDGKDR